MRLLLEIMKWNKCILDENRKLKVKNIGYNRRNNNLFLKCQIEISGGTTGMSAQGRQSGFGTEEKAQGYTEGNIKANKEKTRLVIDGAKKMCYHNLPSSL